MHRSGGHSKHAYGAWSTVQLHCAMRICNSFFITQLLSVQSILSGDMSLWAICILRCFSWFLCWEFVEAHDLHGERPQHQSTHYHSAHYHQRHRRHWVSTSEQFVECLWCRVNYGPPDHKKIRQKFVCFSVWSVSSKWQWFCIFFNWIWTMSNNCNLPTLYQFLRAFYLIFKPQKVGNWRGTCPEVWFTTIAAGSKPLAKQWWSLGWYDHGTKADQLEWYVVTHFGEIKHIIHMSLYIEIYIYTVFIIIYPYLWELHIRLVYVIYMLYLYTVPAANNAQQKNPGYATWASQPSGPGCPMMKPWGVW